MAKRFTDTNKWRKPFIRGLQTPYKLLWLYILDECDHAGIWHVEIDVAKIRIGEELSLNEALKQFKNYIVNLGNSEKWFIRDFISVQYGKLNPLNRAHASVIEVLKENKLLSEIKPLTSPLQGAKEKKKAIFSPPTMDEVRDYILSKKSTVDPETFWNFYQSKNWMIGKNKMKNWHAAIATWERKNRDGTNSPETAPPSHLQEY